MPFDTDRLQAALGDRYRLERELGAGGMATVYLALDLRHNRKVAIKVLRPDLAATLGPDRFIREITIAAGLAHPHILPLHDSGQADGFLFYVMPFVEGQSLRQRVMREGELPVAEAVRILRDIADAMAYAHQHAVVHRDIKPENVMLSGRHALVTDFGVAKAVTEATGRQTLTTAGVAIGTPTYMAPEQASADPHVDHRADIYAFGAVAYELLTGRPPFVGATPQAVLAAHVTMAVDPVERYRPSLPPQLAALVMRCLEKKPADRPQTAEELIPQLEAVLTPSGGLTPTATQPVTAVARRSSPWKAVAAIVLLLAAVGAWWLLTSRKPAAGTKPRLAVLPFENRTGDPSLEYLGRLAAEWITTGLVDAQVMEVVPTQTVAAILRDTLSRPAGDRPLESVAATTHATIVVSGSIYRIGDSLRFGADLNEVQSGRVLATIDPVSASQADAMPGLSGIRERVIARLAAELDPLLGRYATDYDPPSLEILRLMSEHWATFWRGDLAEAERQARRILAIDSTYRIAKLALAIDVMNAGRFAAADTLAHELERDAASLPGNSRNMLAWVRAELDGDREAAYRLTRSGEALNPGGLGTQQLGFEEAKLNRPRAGLEVLQRIDPTSPEMRETPAYWNHFANVLHMLGDHEAELESAQRARSKFPRRLSVLWLEVVAEAARTNEAGVASLLDVARNYAADPAATLGWVTLSAAAELRFHGDSAASARLATRAVQWYEALTPAERNSLRREHLDALAWAGRHREALELLGETCAAGQEGLECRGFSGMLLARIGDTTAARTRLSEIEAIELRPRGLQKFQLLWQACILVALGDSAGGISTLRRAFDRGLEFGTYLHWQTCWSPIRTNPEFVELIRPKG